jgi:hypothetical protein
VITALDGVIDRLGEALAGTQAAESEADELVGQATNMGTTSAIESATAVKDAVESVLPVIQAAQQGTEGPMSTVRSIADSLVNQHWPCDGHGQRRVGDG